MSRYPENPFRLRSRDEKDATMPQGHRRQFVLQAVLAAAFVGIAVTSLAIAADVGWLREVQQVPANPPRERIGKLAPLLMDNKGQAITTREGWERQRTKIRDDW